MLFTLAILGIAASAVVAGPIAAPQPTAPAKLQERQVIAGGFAGTLSDASGTAGGELSPTLQGCVGGAVENDGASLCFPEATPAAKLKDRQVVAGGFAGTLGPASGTAGGELSPTLVGCAGGAIDGEGFTTCFPEATPAAKVQDRQVVAGGFAGTLGPASGTAGGELSPTLVGCAGGAVDGDGFTTCFPKPTA